MKLPQCLRKRKQRSTRNLHKVIFKFSSFFPILKFKIKGHSMEPNLLNNQTVLVSSTPFIFSKPKVGDVVVFKYQNKIYIKRISKIKGGSTSSRFRGASKYFLEGDNKKDSLDSRKIGWISRKQILGKIVFKF